MTDAEYNAFQIAYQKANCELTNREEAVAKAYEHFETNLELLGVTAIEVRIIPAHNRQYNRY